jgi:hypothetical protein
MALTQYAVERPRKFLFQLFWTFRHSGMPVTRWFATARLGKRGVELVIRSVSLLLWDSLFTSPEGTSAGQKR